jgi:hypothetical protein
VISTTIFSASRIIIRTSAALVAIGALAAGCGGDFDPGSRLNSLRVLAVVADKPYAKPGEEVHLTLTAFDPTDLPDGTPTHKTTYAWAACVNPQSSTVVGCLSQFFQDSRNSPGNPLQNGSVTIGTSNVGFKYTIPKNALDGRDGQARANAFVGFVSVVCPGDLKFDPNANLQAGQLALTCVDSDTGRVLDLPEFQLGIKRIFVRATDRNANPVVSGVTWDGAPWPEDEVKAVVGAPTTATASIDATRASLTTSRRRSPPRASSRGPTSSATPSKSS